MTELIGYFFLALGLCFTFLGCLGLIRMPEVYCRLQAATKSVTLGTGSILIASFILTGFSAIGMKAIVCLVFLFLNAPTSAHALGKASYISGIGPWRCPHSIPGMERGKDKQDA
jgi:multicomponent Na+:H+ antiporter subunit G